MLARLRLVVPVVTAAALVVSGCGGSSQPSHPKTAHSTTAAAKAAPTKPTQTSTAPSKSVPGTRRPAKPKPQTGTVTIPTPPPTGIHPSRSAVKVIEAWSSALRRGDVVGAARYFALPSAMVNGLMANGQATVIPIDTVAQAREANASLPCGAKFISADQRGRYVNALFQLTGRPGPGGSDCGAGGTARTNFLIARGRILEWIRAPDEPGDHSGPSNPVPVPVPSQPPTAPSPRPGIVPVA